MSLEGKQLLNVAKTVRQVMVEDQQEQEIEEMIKKVSVASYLDEAQKGAMLEILGFSKKEKDAKKVKQAGDKVKQATQKKKMAADIDAKHAAAKKKEADKWR